MFGYKKKAEKTSDFPLALKALCKNEVSVTIKKPQKNGSPCRSKFGGLPAVPANFVWPRFEAENYEGETAARPLSFLCQINLEEIRAWDTEGRLPERGLLLFFYEMESMCWGFDPADEGCARVYYLENPNELVPAALPEDLSEEYAVKEFDLSFEAKASYPSYEELKCHSDVEIAWDDYDEALERMGYEIDIERHKLLGYANLVQGEMLTECERAARGLYSGDAKSYRETPEDVKKAIKKAAADWVLLFQMTSIQEDDYELMYGDMGNLYFYIRGKDLQERNFDRVWFAVQCG